MSRTQFPAPKGNGWFLTFPTPYPGECFYSVLCRYHQQSGNASGRNSSIQLFGDVPNLSPTVVLPYRLDNSTRWLHPYSGITQAGILSGSTAWQYIQTSDLFTYDDVVKVMEARPHRGRGKQLQMHMATRGKKQKLCYCPQCAVEDYQQFHETYWHLLHQLEGVKYCPWHGTAIRQSKIPLHKTMFFYAPASEIISERLAWNESIEDSLTEAELSFSDQYTKLGRTIDWLLSYGRKQYEGEHMHSFYNNRLLSQNSKKSLVSLVWEKAGRSFICDLFTEEYAESLKTAILMNGMNQQPPLVHALVLMALVTDLPR